MESLDFKYIQQLNHSIQNIYRLRHFESFGVEAIKIMDQLVPSDIPSFLIVNFQVQHIQDTFLPNFPGLTPEMERARIIFFNEHPVIRRLPQTLDGAYKISDFIDQKELESSEGLYQRYLRTLGMADHMCMSLGLSNAEAYSKVDIPAVALYRTSYNFTEHDRLILNLLRPHLFQAYSNVQEYDRLEKSLNQPQQSANYRDLIILDFAGQIQSISPQAASWLSKYFSISANFWHFPDYLWSWVKHQAASIEKGLDQAKTISPLRIQHANQQLVIRLTIEENRYLLLLQEQTTSLLNSLETLELSQRETEVLALVIQGKDNMAIATHMSISITTVRKHLENIYQKWQVNSRTEAIAKALQKLGFINHLSSHH